MKTTTLTQFIIPAMLVLSVVACKKEDADFTSEYKAQTEDQLQISAEIDLVTIDANNIVESNDYFFARRTNVIGICDATFMFDSSAAFKYITINYNGTTCSGKTKRSGQVIISMQRNQRWSDAGAVLNLTYKNLLITRIADNKSIILNGELSLINEAGGRMSELMNKKLVHIIQSSGMNIIFEDGTQRSWQLSVRRAYSFDNGLVMTSTGNHMEGVKKGISAWGVTRAGRPFTTTIAEPMIIRQDCNFRIVSATLIQDQSETLTIKFGLSEKAEIIACPVGNYFLQVSWINASKKNKSLMVQY